MFNEINGLPTHALALHAAVVLVPLAAALGILFAVPRTRAWSRVPLLLVSLGAVGAVFVARKSGQQLEAVIYANLPEPTQKLIDEHAGRANVLLNLTIAYAVVAVAAFVLTLRSTRNSLLTIGLSVLLVIGAGGVAFQSYRVGDIGARAVWNPTGDIDYGSSSGED